MAPRRLARVAVAIAAAALAGAPSLQGRAWAQEDSPTLTQDERARILAFGPWPGLAGATSGDATLASAVALGESLFNSARISGDGRLRCASCHEPWRRFTDGRPRAQGRIEGARNTPSLVDVSRRRTLGWDGAFDRLEAQSLRPLLDPDEMASTPSHVAAVVRGDAGLRARYEAALGRAPSASDDAVFADVGRLLAAYETTLASGRTRFDAFRDALAAAPAGAPLDASALRGLRLFIGRAGCASCHAGPAFTDDELHVSTTRSRRADGTFDTGRAGGRAYAFRTPTLRGVTATAPYMHDGHVARLCDAVRPHALADRDGLEPTPAPTLAASERTDLVAFLRTLDVASDDAIATDAAPARCSD